jgi:catechol 2,3-dioxygenase-like lactoylglutathione lyase family enzyme
MPALPDTPERSTVSWCTTLDHVTIVTDDFEASRPVYDAVFGAIGMAPVTDFVDPEAEEGDPGTVAAVGYAPAGSTPVVVLAAGMRSTTNSHFALAVSDRMLIDAVQRAIVGIEGAELLQGARDWEERQLGYYGIQITDPRSNIIELLHRG